MEEDSLYEEDNYSYEEDGYSYEKKEDLPTIDIETINNRDGGLVCIKISICNGVDELTGTYNYLELDWHQEDLLIEYISEILEIELEN